MENFRLIYWHSDKTKASTQKLKKMSKSVEWINEISIIALDEFEPVIAVIACGSVPTSGWTSPKLIPNELLNLSSTDILNLNLVATAPKCNMDALSIQSTIWTEAYYPLRQDLKSVCVIGLYNSKVIELNLVA